MFDLVDDKMQPRGTSSGNDVAWSSNRHLLDFLDTLRSFELLSTEAGKVVYADDQFINQQSMKMNFTDVGILDELVMCSDGQEVVDFFD